MNFKEIREYSCREPWEEAYDLFRRQTSFHVNNLADNVYDLVAEQIEMQICNPIMEIL